ncbi:MAG: hypothetical protein ACOH2Q_13080 [Rhodococcus sp. (in: high G+C Gram-positive bacteria)]
MARDAFTANVKWDQRRQTLASGSLPTMTEFNTHAAQEVYLYDGPASRRGYNMNKLFMSLIAQQARDEFAADEAAYCARFSLSQGQTEAVVERNWQAMLDLGGSIFYIYKLAMIDGRSMQYLGGVFTGMTEREFVAAMDAGGRTDV